MNGNRTIQKPALMDMSITPHLKTAIHNWFEAMRQFQVEPALQNQNRYEIATNELGQAISQWRVEQPELFEQFKFWFCAHVNG